MNIIHCSCWADLGETSVPTSELAVSVTQAPAHSQPWQGKGMRKGEEKKKEKKAWRGKFIFFLTPQSWQTKPLKGVIWLISLAMHSNRSYTHAEGNEGNYIFSKDM